MEISTATKKKKRRTRKCLDEIRKRSRRTMRTDDNFGHQPRKKMNRTDERQTPRLITMNRLTLNMFPKAIRSETITRPLLEEIKQKSSLNTKEVSDKNFKLNCIDSLKVECFEHCNSAISNNSMPMFDVEEECLHADVRNHSENLLKNYQTSHTSPIHVGMTQTSTEVMADIYSTSNTSSESLQTSDGDHIHELYEELMNTISSHLNSLTSTLFKEDRIQIAKLNLQKLYNKSWSKQYKTATVEHENNNTSTEFPEDVVVQNPLNYLKHRDVQQQSMHLGLSDVVSSSLSPEQTEEPVSETLHSSLAFKTECNRDVTLYATPEYNYYPHRLNQ